MFCDTYDANRKRPAPEVTKGASKASRLGGLPYQYQRYAQTYYVTRTRTTNDFRAYSSHNKAAVIRDYGVNSYLRWANYSLRRTGRVGYSPNVQNINVVSHANMNIMPLILCTVL